METTSILLILLAVLLSFIASWFLYFFKNIQIKKVDYLLFVLRFLAFFLMLLIWINPSIKHLKISNQKPILSILIDNSSSIKHLHQESTVLNTFNLLKNDAALSNKLNVHLTVSGIIGFRFLIQNEVCLFFQNTCHHFSNFCWRIYNVYSIFS